MADKAFQMDIASIGLQGMQQAEARVNKGARDIAKGEVDPQDVVELSAAVRHFQASAKMVTTGDEMTKTTIDLLG
jgi:flagellar hook protein FlgE